MDILFALIGLAGFEGVRLLKRVFSEQPAIPDQTGVYLVALALVAIFTAGIGYAMDLDSAIKSIFVGFSVPSGAKTILEPQAKEISRAPSTAQSGSDEDHTDDIQVSTVFESEKANETWSISSVSNVYFGR